MTSRINRDRDDSSQRRMTKLSNRDRDIFLALLNSAARPNKALLAAAKEYKAWLQRAKE